MGILGKIVLVLNFLVVGGFTYLALQDWKGRQTIAAGGLRHFLLLRGLPLGDLPGDPATVPTDPEEEIPFRTIGPGEIPTETVSPELLKSYFAMAGGGGAAVDGQVALASSAPVPNQLAEVKRVYALLKSEIDKQDGAKQKAVAAGGWLRLQAQTIEERDDIQALIAAGNGDELLRRLFMKFDQVVNPPKLPDVSTLASGDNDDQAAVKDRLVKASELNAGGVKDQAERLARIAHLLVHLDRGAAWQKRVMLVVGVRRYAKAVADQAIRFREMAERVERTAADDEARFTAEYSQLRGLAIQRTQAVREMADNRARLASQAQKDADFVKQRETQLADLNAQLVAIKAQVDQLLASQTLTEQQLFVVQQEVAETLAKIYEKQAELARKERARYAKATAPK